ncbi:MAG: DUF4037 domain-containing protein [Acutalibacteraceae bacterium]|nr:DUF4037 domain-containing protein [Acutalibacteraceae bacterium]
MQGIELSRRYYEEYGIPMIKDQFSEFESRIAVGLAGPGSDCFGFDDEISRDHDFGAGFCLWLTDEDNELFGFQLARAYGRLPKIFMDTEKGKTNSYGTARYGVKTISDFYLPLTGSKGAPESPLQWLYTPESSLAAATNGCVFRDDSGKFSEIRNKIANGMPEDIKLKKLAARLIFMAQSGQYNFSRCISHGETGAAALAAAEFVKNTASFVYLINGKFAPFYKWMLRGMKNLELFPDFSEKLSALLTGGFTPDEIKIKQNIIEDICSLTADYLRNSDLAQSGSDFLEPLAYQVQNKIRNPEIRSLHIMEGGSF